jgi:hypothetical protein
MKKVLIVVLLFLVACGTSSEGDNETVGEDEEIPEQPVEREQTKADLVPQLNTETLYPDLNQEMRLWLGLFNRGFQKIDEDITYTFTLSKAGTVLHDQTGVERATLFASTEMELYETTYTFESYGQYELTAKVDTKDVLFELEEWNNNKTVTIFVNEPVVEEPEEPEVDEDGVVVKLPGCIDTDGGKDEDEFGTCTDEKSFLEGRSDFCSGDEELAEMVCRSDACQIDIIICENVCRDGICL